MSRRGDRFSRKGGGNSAQDEIGRTVYQAVERLMENRWKYLNQFDVVNDYHAELYRYAMSDDEWTAWNVLRQNKRFTGNVSFTQNLYLRKRGHFSITIERPGELFLAMRIDWESLPELTQERIHNWLIRSETYREEYKLVRERVKSLTLICATAGQIERVWPELLGFMPEETKDRRFTKRAVSPYPEGVWEDGWESLHPSERKLKEKWRPESLAWFNDALAEALILPQQDWKTYPPFPTVEFEKQ